MPRRWPVPNRTAAVGVVASTKGAFWVVTFLVDGLGSAHMTSLRQRRFAVVLAAVVIATGCTGFDTSHFSCWDAAYLRANPTLGPAPHKFDAGSGKDHRCTKAELDAAGVPNDERPADQR